MHNSLLQSLGLTPEESGVYELMLELGVAPIQKILPKSGLKRGTLYNVLHRLADKGLLAEKEGTKKATFEVASPAALEKFMSAEAARIEENKKRLADRLPQLQSLYNLAMHKPNVQFFEGLEGVQKVLDDSLTAKTENYTYIDNEAVNKYIEKLNETYVKRRAALGIKKKMITIDSSYIRNRVKTFDPALTAVHVIDGKNYPFATVMQIYDNKVSYITLNDQMMIGIIVDDEAITRMHKTLFEFMWEKTPALLEKPTQPTQPRPVPPSPATPPPSPTVVSTVPTDKM